MLPALLLTLVAQTGTVRIHLVDAHGKPVPNRHVWLETTRSSKAVRPFGVHWGAPNNILDGTTNAKGDVIIKGVAKGQPMAVVVSFGPRFDPFVKKKIPDLYSGASTFTMDTMRLDGAVYAGRTSKVILADDCRIEGKVTDRETGRPRGGIKIYLSDTGFGHMGGYPGTTVDETVTDANGAFVFHRLPNLELTLGAVPEMPFTVESRAPGEKWSILEIMSKGGGGWGSSYSVRLDKPITKVEFRISKPATLNIKMNLGDQKREDWTIWVGEDSVGRVLAGKDDFICAVMPGKHRVRLERHDGKTIFIGWLTLKPGEHRDLSYKLLEMVDRVKKP